MLLILLSISDTGDINTGEEDSMMTTTTSRERHHRKKKKKKKHAKEKRRSLATEISKAHDEQHETSARADSTARVITDEEKMTHMNYAKKNQLEYTPATTELTDTRGGNGT